MSITGLVTFGGTTGVELRATCFQAGALPLELLLFASVVIVVLIWWGSGLNSGFHIYKAGALLLECLQSIFVLVLLEMDVSQTI
jgi:hypothetical protein